LVKSEIQLITKTFQTGKIWAILKGNKIMLMDETGTFSTVATLINTVGIFVIDRVLMPKKIGLSCL
jgi:hypothetical protein